MENFLKKNGVIVVAEVSANHNKDLKLAMRMIEEAKACGADAVKFQVYTPDTLTINEDNRFFRIDHPKWGGQTLYELYGKAYTPWDWFGKLKREADKLDIGFFATAFSKDAVDLLDDIGVGVHKIASFELVDLELIRYAASTKKPLIISTGMAAKDEIQEALNAARRAGSRDIMLLKCVSSYPARPDDMNLASIPDMAKRFKCSVGFSDHSLGIGAAITAVNLGARLIEKHFTLSRKIKTPDSFFSIEPDELKALVANVRIAEKCFGKVSYGLTASERKSKVFRRSLFAVSDVKKGSALTKNNVASIRPAYGLKPKYLKDVLRRRAKKDIKRGTPLQWDLIA